MKLSRWVGGVVVTTALVVGGMSSPAWAKTSGLQWRSPHRITTGVPVRVASISACPAVPTPGDSVLVQINLSFGSGGGAGDVLAADLDGSWSGNVTFFFSGVNIRRTTISAQCLDFNGITGVPYAQYRVHHTKIFG